MMSLPPPASPLRMIRHAADITLRQPREASFALPPCDKRHYSPRQPIRHFSSRRDYADTPCQMPAIIAS